MKNKTLNRTLLAALVVSSLLSPAVMAACHGTDLNPCPAPFDATLPDTAQHADLESGGSRGGFS
ncbi:hypothetical protein [Enterobacter bugandensis]|uniref:hypothetical protein n=1 Tax=Enterobacter bugandensis TaxID=881260 RepID=UPI002156FF09|nr:hypothetical protein [Enterobacter bugandensis]MCR6710941.1 hypothetical protein [Enterobacter bugandensis]